MQSKSRSSALKGSDSIFGMLNVNAKPLDSNQPITSPRVMLALVRMFVLVEEPRPLACLVVVGIPNVRI
jgi:hypothetical protein